LCPVTSIHMFVQTPGLVLVQRRQILYFSASPHK
jgi:hypothetical protein